MKFYTAWAVECDLRSDLRSHITDEWKVCKGYYIQPGEYTPRGGFGSVLSSNLLGYSPGYRPNADNWLGFRFAWHEKDSKSADLAMQLLANVLEDRAEAKKYHLRFRDEFLLKLSPMGWCITEEDIRNALDKIKGEIK